MPKRPLKKTPARKPTSKRKTPSKRKKPTAKAAPHAPPAGKGFMWKLLERKQAELKRMTGSPQHPYGHAQGKTPFSPKPNAPTRFAGPRRKAA